MHKHESTKDFVKYWAFRNDGYHIEAVDSRCLEFGAQNEGVGPLSDLHFWTEEVGDEKEEKDPKKRILGYNWNLSLTRDGIKWRSKIQCHNNLKHCVPKHGTEVPNLVS